MEITEPLGIKDPFKVQDIFHKLTQIDKKFMLFSPANEKFSASVKDNLNKKNKSVPSIIKNVPNDGSEKSRRLQNIKN